MPFCKNSLEDNLYTFNLPPPSNVSNMFGKWLNGVEKESKGHNRVGVCALLWAICTIRNDIIFNKNKSIIFGGYPFVSALDTYMVLPANDYVDIDIGCNCLATVAHDL
jgi:hypothetical protein